jgi:hypothetical protein
MASPEKTKLAAIVDNDSVRNALHGMLKAVIISQSS